MQNPKHLHEFPKKEVEILFMPGMPLAKKKKRFYLQIFCFCMIEIGEQDVVYLLVSKVLSSEKRKGFNWKLRSKQDFELGRNETGKGDRPSRSLVTQNLK